MSEKSIVVRVRDPRTLRAAQAAGFTEFLLERDLPVNGSRAYRIREGHVFEGTRRVGGYFPIRTRADADAVFSSLRGLKLAIVEPKDWKIIPLENLIAANAGRTRLFATARDAAEARTFLETLERGVDGVVITPQSVADVASFTPLLRPDAVGVALQPVRLTRIQPMPAGDRVCVDTANLFGPREGLLVGSTSRLFFLVVAEREATEHAAARPFRVNAGAVHCYLWDGERTRYLSEVRAGDAVRAVDAKGTTRALTVGRAKVETRPLILLEADTPEGPASVLLQNAETIRLLKKNGRATSVTRLRVGDEVLAHVDSGGRHFGMRVDETVREV